MIRGSTGNYSPFVHCWKKETQQAAELFSQLPQDLNDTQRHEQTLLSAELKVARKRLRRAKKILGTIDLSTLDKNQ